jgi:flavin reductase (DIM6/NTAB) family NADH-FMN oxidoreductase RutF
VGSQVFSPREFRNALARFATGVTVVTALHSGKAHAMTANAFVSVSLDSPLVLVSLDNRSRMHQILPAVGRAGTTLLDGALAHFVLKVSHTHPAGDHTLYVGSVEYFEYREDKPLLFYAGGYQLIRG